MDITNKKKTCTKCKIEKDINEFSLARKGVYRSRCNICKNEDYKIYCENNKEKVKKSKDTWSKKNSEYYKLYYEENKDNIQKYFNQYYSDKKEDILKNVKIYYNENKEEIIKKSKIRKSNDIDLYKLKCKEYYKKVRLEYPHRIAWRCLLQNALRRMNTKKSDKTIDMLGYSADDLKNYLESKFEEGMSWDNWGDWEVDHIKPVSLFDLKTDSKIVNALENLQPLWWEENIKKFNHYYAKNS